MLNFIAVNANFSYIEHDCVKHNFTRYWRSRVFVNDSYLTRSFSHIILFKVNVAFILDNSEIKLFIFHSSFVISSLRYICKWNYRSCMMFFFLKLQKRMFYRSPFLNIRYVKLVFPHQSSPAWWLKFRCPVPYFPADSRINPEFVILLLSFFPWLLSRTTLWARIICEPRSETNTIMYKNSVFLFIKCCWRLCTLLSQLCVTQMSEEAYMDHSLILSVPPTAARPAIHLETTYRDQYVRPGSRVSLRCVTSGNPLPVVTWTLDDSPLTMEDSRYGFGQFSTADGDIYSYVNITNVKIADGGTYTCLSVNKEGQATHQAKVFVYGKSNLTGEVFWKYSVILKNLSPLIYFSLYEENIKINLSLVFRYSLHPSNA